MTESDIRVYLHGAVNYFRQVSPVEAELETPYLRTGENVFLDYTGAIRVTGQERGCVMFSARRSMLHDLLQQMGENEFSEQNYQDAVGEITNTISGNARKTFGSGFAISVPRILDAEATREWMQGGRRTFVIPIRWNRHRSHLLVTLES